MKESSFGQNSHFKALSDEDLFIEEAEPLNNISFSFRYWPRTGTRLYNKRSILVYTLLVFGYGFVVGFFVFKKLHHSSECYGVRLKNYDFSVLEVVSMLHGSSEQPESQPNPIDNQNGVTNYNEALMLEEHFKNYQFDEVSPILSSKVTLTFKNEYKPDALEIVVEKGDIRYRNVRNATFSYVIPREVDETSNFSNTVSGLPVYGNFGTDDDFQYLQQHGISVRECIILLRLGKISIQEKVSAALRQGVRGILLFADPQQYPNSDHMSVNEEISPTELTTIHRLNSSYSSQCIQDCGVAIQIIESITARNILRDMAVTNKSPNSWHGSLNALYSIGPGFSAPNGSLILYSNFVRVRYTAYDVAAFLRSPHESDRYIIVGNSRKSLRVNDRTNRSTNAILAISKYLAEARSKGWEPSRTLVFCSFGLEEIENYSPESWISRHINIVKQRTVAYTNVAEPVQGFDYLNVQINPLLRNLLSNMSELVLNPHENEKFSSLKTLLDTWQSKPDYSNESDQEHLTEESKNSTTEPKNSKEWNFSSQPKMIELFESFGIPTVSFSYGSRIDKKKLNQANISEYERCIHQLWTLLIFSLADNLIVPFNVSSYIMVLDSLSTEIEERILPENTSLASDFYKFSLSVKNLIPVVQKFQINIQLSRKEDIMKRRFINDKLMFLGKLFACGKETTDLLLTKFGGEVPNKLKMFQASLKRGTNCMEEIHSAVQNIYD